MKSESAIQKQIERANERERVARRNYHAKCRQIIAYQIENFRIENNLIGTGNEIHIDHAVIPFAFIVDQFRELIHKYYSLIPTKTNRLPVSISELSTSGKWFMEFHRNIAVLEAVSKSENLQKASNQKRSNNYGLTDLELSLAKEQCKKEFLKLTNGVEVFQYCHKTIKPENKGKSLGEYKVTDCK